LFAGQTVPPVRGVVERVISAVDAHSVGVAQFDDITCLALRWCPTAEVSSGIEAPASESGVTA
jgi:hypothetical protein